MQITIVRKNKSGSGAPGLRDQFRVLVVTVPDAEQAQADMTLADLTRLWHHINMNPASSTVWHSRESARVGVSACVFTCVCVCVRQAVDVATAEAVGRHIECSWHSDLVGHLPS